MASLRTCSCICLLLFSFSIQEIVAADLTSSTTTPLLYPWKAETKHKYYYDTFEDKMTEVLHGKPCLKSYKVAKPWDYQLNPSYTPSLYLVPTPPTEDAILEWRNIPAPKLMRTTPSLCRTGYEFKSRPIFKQTGCNVDLLSHYAPRCQNKLVFI